MLRPLRQRRRGGLCRNALCAPQGQLHSTVLNNAGGATWRRVACWWRGDRAASLRGSPARRRPSCTGIGVTIASGARCGPAAGGGSSGWRQRWRRHRGAAAGCIRGSAGGFAGFHNTICCLERAGSLAMRFAAMLQSILHCQPLPTPPAACCRAARCTWPASPRRST